MSPKTAAPIPPSNLDAEESVLGAMMLTSAAIDDVVEECRAEDFYRVSHSKMFEAAVALRGEDRPVDAITLSDELDRRGQLEDVGGQVRVHEIAALVPASRNARHYARIVREMAVLRGIIYAGSEITRLGWDRNGAEIPEIMDKVERLVFDLASGRDTSDFVTAGAQLDETFRKMRDAFDSGRSVTGVATGFHAIDQMTSGFQPGNLIVIAGRPSMGKSGLAICAAANIAIFDGLPVGLFTLEMSRAEVTQRLLSATAHVESQKLRNGQLASEEWKRLHDAAAKIEQAPLYIDDSGLITVMEIRSKARRLKMRHPNLALVIVDYLQLLTSGSGKENRVQEVSQITRGLKVLAGEINTPVLALSQLSRAPEQRHDQRPVLSDLRESGSIEQDSDLVLIIYRDEYYHPEETDQAGIAEINFAKHRNGATGTVKLSFVSRYAKFSDLHPEL